MTSTLVNPVEWRRTQGLNPRICMKVAGESVAETTKLPAGNSDRMVSGEMTEAQIGNLRMRSRVVRKCTERVGQSRPSYGDQTVVIRMVIVP